MYSNRPLHCELESVTLTLVLPTVGATRAGCGQVPRDPPEVDVDDVPVTNGPEGPTCEHSPAPDGRSEWYHCLKRSIFKMEQIEGRLNEVRVKYSGSCILWHCKLHHSIWIPISYRVGLFLRVLDVLALCSEESVQCIV